MKEHLTPYFSLIHGVDTLRIIIMLDKLLQLILGITNSHCDGTLRCCRISSSEHLNRAPNIQQKHVIAHFF